MIMSSLHHSLKVGLSLLAVQSPVWAQKHVVPLSEDKAITLNVSNRSLNRLSIKGDRIQEVVGLDEVLTVERSDQHGHLFIRFPEGYTKRLDLTIITEGGSVQDLSLIPSDQEATTVILKSEESEKKSEDTIPSLSASHEEVFLASKGQGYAESSLQGQVIGVMKLLYQGYGDSSDLIASLSRTTPYGLRANPLRFFERGRYVGEVFSITNDRSTTLNVVEKDFYKTGDIALAVGKRQLGEGESTLLFVVRQRESL